MKNNMQNLRQIASLIIWLLLIMSAVFNILFMFGKISLSLMHAGFLIFIGVLFIISLLGIILKIIRKDDVVQLNIMTPVKEIGKLFVWTLIIWVVSYLILILFNENIVLLAPFGGGNEIQGPFIR